MDIVQKPKICPYCGAEVLLLNNKAVYKYNYGSGLVYKCSRCDAYVGTHKGTVIPLGTLANAELRQYRKQAHSCFDTLWKSQVFTRDRAYEWLAKKLKLPKEKTHIGMFNKDQCKLVIFWATLELSENWEEL